MFSQACKYGIRAMFLIAQRSKEERFIGIKEVAEGLDAPVPFIAKILQDLSKKGFMISAKGPNGGFMLSQAQKQITLNDIVVAIDGNKLITSCCLGLRDCNEKSPCPVHEEYKIIRKTIASMLSTTRVSDFNNELSLSKLFLRDK
jgi:Rrf2 family protein